MKTSLTKSIERGAFRHFAKLGTFICAEVGITTIDTYEKTYNIHNEDYTHIVHERKTEIVDVLAYNYTAKEWYCYEIKISKADFHSKSKKTFIGNYNYYIMPYSLYEKVYNEIPNHIGCYIVADSDFKEDTKYLKPQIVKRAKRQDLMVEWDVLYYSMIKSLYRDVENYERGTPRYINDDRIKNLEYYIAEYKRNNSYLEKYNKELQQKLNDKDYCPRCEELKWNLKRERNANERLKKELEESK